MSILRRTVCRAFAAPAGKNNSVMEPGIPRDHAQAIGRFFRNLLQAFRRRCVLQGHSRDGRGADSAIRLLEGLEFVIETPRGVFRFQNSLHGAISIRELLDAGGGVEVELLGVQRRDECYVPIRKAAKTDSTMAVQGGSPGNFSFTSVHALVEEYMDREMARHQRAGIENDPD